MSLMCGLCQSAIGLLEQDMAVMRDRIVVDIQAAEVKRFQIVIRSIPSPRSVRNARVLRFAEVPRGPPALPPIV